MMNSSPAQLQHSDEQTPRVCSKQELTFCPALLNGRKVPNCVFQAAHYQYSENGKFLGTPIYGDRQDKRAVAEELIEHAMEFGTAVRSYAGSNARADHGLETLAKLALSGSGAEAVARAIRRSASNEGGGRFGKLCRMLTSRFPVVVLDEIVGPPHPDGIVDEFFGGIFRDDDGGESTDALDADVAHAWVARDPGPRAKRLAQFVPYFRQVENADELEWSPMAIGLIDAAPDPVQLLETLERRFRSRSGSGSFASRFVRRRPLVAAMAGHAERRARNWAREASLRLE